MDATQRLIRIFGERLLFDQPLAKFTSARVGGTADLFITVRQQDELQAACEIAFEQGIPYFILGGGSNILVSDAGVRGLVIQNRCKHVMFQEDDDGRRVICTAGSGTNLSSLTRTCVNKGLRGLEWAISVPGTVGGAVVGNAGAHGSDMNTNLISATIWEPDGGVKTYTKAEMVYAYRDSTLKVDMREGRPRRVVLAAELELFPYNVEIVQAQVNDFVAHRKRTQPAGATMGSVFKNPEHQYAGYLIDMAGLKGTRIGGAHVSQKHGNFFINDENATAQQIAHLISAVQERIKADFEVMLEPEVELVGKWN